MKRQSLIHYSWLDFSRAFVNQHLLPRGTKLVLYDINGRRKRSDWQVKVKRQCFRDMTEATGNTKVSDLLKIARLCLSTDLITKQLKLRLVGPNGSQINGNTQLNTVRTSRREPQVLTDEERKLRDYEISELRRRAASELQEAEYLIDDPAECVPQAYVAELIDRYGSDHILESFQIANRHALNDPLLDW